MIVLYILLALLVFGFMIFFHELGHFAFAKLFKVAISEFSIGMGPKIFSKKGKDGVSYSLRALPIGGYVAMEGETEESDDPNSFDKKPPYQRFIITIAGAVMNILIAIIVVFFITLSAPHYGTTTIYSFDDGSTAYQGLLQGDRIVQVNNDKVTTLDELSYAIMINGNKPVDIIVVRDNQTQTIEDVSFPIKEEDGFKYGQMNFKVYGEKRSFKSIIKNTYHTSVSTVKMIWDSLIGIFTGRFSIKQVSGPIGVTGAMVDMIKFGPRSFFYMVAVISMNLGVFNLLPIPALDGGTLLFTGIEMVFKKRIPKKIEDTIKLTFFGILILLIVIVSVKDVITLIF